MTNEERGMKLAAAAVTLIYFFMVDYQNAFCDLKY